MHNYTLFSKPSNDIIRCCIKQPIVKFKSHIVGEQFVHDGLILEFL